MPQLDLTRPTALYRLFDADSRLLYIGIAFDPEERWVAHSVDKIWWRDVTEKRSDWYATRSEALEAELEAIKAERPLYNKADSDNPFSGPVHRPEIKTPRVIRVPDDAWEAYGQVCAAEGTTRSDDIRRYMHAEIKAHRAEQRRIAAEERAAES